MRGFKVIYVVAALCCAARAEASRPACLEWEWVRDDTGEVVSVPVESADGGDGGSTSARPPMHQVCKRSSCSDEVGCSVAGGLPTAGMALAALALMALRARRKVR
ncbi:MAG TPA: MYXO-CTERM sorting domain-containing protein [Myxococcaceae bacterium]|jgi:hypothetical protein